MVEMRLSFAYQQSQLYSVPSAYNKGLAPGSFIFQGLIEHTIVVLLLIV